MNREILFRGKHKGQWVYGSLICCTNFEGQPFYQIDNGKMNDHQVWDVDPETVGQFTGFTDKNGTKIFEGDKYKTSTHELEFIVTFHAGAFIGGNGHIGTPLGWSCGFDESVNDYTGDLLVDEFTSKIEITGNIHDK